MAHCDPIQTCATSTTLEDPFEQHPQLASEADVTGDEHAQAGVGDRVKQGPGSRDRAGGWGGVARPTSSKSQLTGCCPARCPTGSGGSAPVGFLSLADVAGEVEAAAYRGISQVVIFTS